MKVKQVLPSAISLSGTNGPPALVLNPPKGGLGNRALL
jgi:hypothetical protein